jgi:RNA polymerase sigma factor (sigma-70 family)
MDVLRWRQDSDMTETTASPSPGGQAERSPSDDRLAQRATKGDRRAFAAIYRRYHQDLYRYCAAIVGNPEDAQDALQNTMLKVLGALPGERRQIKLKPWLYRIAHNESVELLRRRRPTEEIDVEIEMAGSGAAETAELRERLGGLIADLRELPDRQRGALVMRELAGLSFDQIAAAFETSPAVVRQTVYEARVGLQQMSEGRDMACEEARRAISDGDRRTIRRRDIRAHLRGCPKCRAFEAGMVERHNDLTALAPLPAVAAAGLLQGVLGGAHGGSGAGVLGTLGGGAGKVAATSAVVKSAAVVAVVAVAGVSATNRAGLTHVGPPGGGGGSASSSAEPGGATGRAGDGGGAAGAANDARHGGAAKDAKGDGTDATGGQGHHGNANADAEAHGAKGQHGNGANGNPGGEHRSGGPSSNPGAGHRSQGASNGHSQSSSHSQGKATSTPHSGATPSHPSPPASPPSHANDPPVAPEAAGGQAQADGHAPDNSQGRPF